MPAGEEEQSAGAPKGGTDDRLTAIAEAAAAFSDAVPDIEALLAIVAEHISRTTGDFCAVVLLSQDGRSIEPVAAYHPNPEVLRDASQFLGRPIDLEASGPWKRVLTERRSLVTGIDPDNLPPGLAPHQVRNIQKWRMRETAMIPMVAQDTVVGGLTLNRMEGSVPFGPEELGLLEGLASRAARAIATAQVLRHQRLATIELEEIVAERTKQLSAANQFLDSIIENIPNMIFVKDADQLRFVRFNKAGEDLLGYSRDDLIGKNDFDFFSAKQAEFFTAKDRKTLKERDLEDIAEEPVETRHKGTRILHTKKIPILDSSGQPAFLLGISEDITEARKDQEALRAAQEEAERANRAKSQFLANMSHELRTPLNAILGFSELLGDDLTGRYDDATRRRFLDQIHSSGRHLLQLINDILDLSKVEAGQVELHLEPLKLASSVKDAMATVEPLARTKRIRLETEIDPGLQLVADAGKLKQMLLNLASNAIKFTPEDGRVRIGARQVGEWIEITVSDSGIGIAQKDLKSLFTEFHQLDAGPGRQQEGTGLGLALTKRFAELHGGQVSVESEVGKGSTFTVILPVEGKAKKLSRPQTHEAPAVDTSRPLVLVVDDNPQATEILGRHLEAGGFRMEVARTGPEALRMARDLGPVAITLDVLLPQMDGWEILTRLKADELTHNIPVVMISVVDHPALGRALGAVDYFVKPVNGNALLARLAQYTFSSKAASQPLRVLVVDDERANLDLLEGLLAPAGFRVLRAGGGRDGIEMASSERPDLVLLDLMMPDVNGFDVVEALRSDERTRAIPIMVLTAKVLTEDDKRALNGQVAAIFQRNSLAGAELVDWLHGIVARRRAS